ncbi:MAG: rod shape-determining protein MreC [Planctomyces sp.]|nr:rod shape-determining protein MreC [Planctomyces sp.]
MPRRRFRNAWIVGALGLIGGGVLCAAPQVVQDSIRGLARDALRPGLVLGAIAREQVTRPRVAQPAPSNGGSDGSREELEQWRRRARQALAIADRLQRDLDQMTRERPAPYIGERGQPLLVPQIIDARILVRSVVDDLGQAAATIDRGQQHTAGTDQWVLSADELVIDQGESADIAADNPVLAGRAVFGRIATTGRWTSQVTHLSQAGFRVHARLVRESPNGLVQGAEGILVGLGDGRCRLELIPATLPVEPGDMVLTAEPAPGIGESLYLGDVMRAEIPAGSAHWAIDVRPGVAVGDVERVQVVRAGLNPVRTAAATTQPGDASRSGVIPIPIEVEPADGATP